MTKASSDANPYGLSPVECDLMDCIAAGCRDKTAARKLSCDPGTVSDRAKRVYRKMGILSSQNRRVRAAVMWDRFRRVGDILTKNEDS